MINFNLLLKEGIIVPGNGLLPDGSKHYIDKYSFDIIDRAMKKKQNAVYFNEENCKFERFNSKTFSISLMSKILTPHVWPTAYSPQNCLDSMPDSPGPSVCVMLCKQQLGYWLCNWNIFMHLRLDCNTTCTASALSNDIEYSIKCLIIFFQ